jgi:hypothetical protein
MLPVLPRGSLCDARQPVIVERQAIAPAAISGTVAECALRAIPPYLVLFASGIER